MTIFDSSGIEAFVTENNPKYANRIIRQLKAYIPLNARSSLKNADYTINENGIPCCPLDESLSMKYEGISKLKSGFTRYKFVCPKIKWVYDSATKKYHRECLCDTPCTPSKSGRMVYIYPEKDLRAYPGTIRGTDEWDNTYKIRTVVEREINHIKENLCLAGRRTQNEKTLHLRIRLLHEFFHAFNQDCKRTLVSFAITYLYIFF